MSCMNAFWILLMDTFQRSVTCLKGALYQIYVMLLQRAMRYYRLWIYTCNVLLLLSVLVFICVAAYIITDFRFALIPGLKLYQPTFIYAYVALVVQAAVLQTIGCTAAIRLNERLLNAYWILMLILLVGDVLVGLVWIFRYQHIRTNLKPDLKRRLQSEFGVNTEFSLIWARLQSQAHCCGVEGPEDYNNSKWLESLSIKYEGDTTVHQHLIANSITLPPSCCTGITNNSLNVGRRQWTRDHKDLGTNEKNASCFFNPGKRVFSPCATPLLDWIENSADILLVIGYCVIVFFKVCFLGILRYEIKEMIQKIKVLKSENSNASELFTLGQVNNPQSPNKQESGVTESFPSSILTTPLHLARLHRFSEGTDSDTNSNSALIEDPIPAVRKMKPNGNNNNEFHELQEFRNPRKQTQI